MNIQVQSFLINKQIFLKFIKCSILIAFNTIFLGILHAFFRFARFYNSLNLQFTTNHHRSTFIEDKSINKETINTE